MGQPTRIHLWLPTRPYTLIDAINRCAAATGSLRMASLTEHADYNGHYVTVGWNDFRKYWITQYTWCGRVVLTRGSLEICLRSARREYDRGALGATVLACVRTEDEAQAARAMGYQDWSEEIAAAHSATFRDPRFDEVPSAIKMHTDHLLIQSATIEEYREKRAVALAQRYGKVQS